MYKLLAAILLSLLIYACETTDPGCLDLNAENYDVFAITECDSCCEYPDANLSAFFKFGEIDTLLFSTKYAYTDTDSIILTDFQLVFSDFTFFSDGTEVKILDTVRNEQPIVYDDFVVVERNARNKSIGMTNYIGLVDSVDFSVGLDPNVLSQLSPLENVSTDSKFRTLYNKMYVDTLDQLFQLRMSLQVNDSIRQINISEVDFTGVGIGLRSELKPGVPWSIPMAIDIFTLIDGISSADTNEMMAATIADNLPNSIEGR